MHDLRRWPRLAFYLINGLTSGDPKKIRRFNFCGENGAGCLEAARTPWQEIRDAAEGADRTSACTFTTFVGYEVDRRSEHQQPAPQRALPERGRAEAADQLRRRGQRGRSLAPHRRRVRKSVDPLRRGDRARTTQNLEALAASYFQTVKEDGTPIDAAYAHARRGGTAGEIMQHRATRSASSAARTPATSCYGFEKLPYDNFGGKFSSWMRHAPEDNNFLRNVLKTGLLEEEKLGVNPFKLGIIASTDTHLGTPGAVDEQIHPATAAPRTRDPTTCQSACRRHRVQPGRLAVLYAEENSRDALFAMRRREALPARAVAHRRCASSAASACRTIYARIRTWSRLAALGVPMGGDLRALVANAGAPSFDGARAERDGGTASQPGTLLQRADRQGWLIENGTAQGRRCTTSRAAQERCRHSRSASTSGRGADALCNVRTDFDPRSAPSTTRPRELTCRWSTRVCNKAGVLRRPEHRQAGLRRLLRRAVAEDRAGARLDVADLVRAGREAGA